MGSSLLTSVFGWLIIAPIAWLVPKRRDWITVIGRQHGRFLDNAKYFYLAATSDHPDLQIAFVSQYPAVAAAIRANHLRVLRYPSWQAVWYLARCGTAVVDSTDWDRHFRGFLLLRASIVQLWHGVGAKRIELDRWHHETGPFAFASHAAMVAVRLAVYRFTRRRVTYAAVAASSSFYRDAVFQFAFSAKNFPVTGYPRNDFAQSLSGVYRELAWFNVDARIRQQLPTWQERKRKLVLFAPTFRDSGAAPMLVTPRTAQALDSFAEEHGVEFLFKFHPSERNASRIKGRHIHLCAAESDVYPLMPCLAALVTDYSSIATDFLLIDKPLLYLIPDQDDYTRKDRQLQFDPNTMMPGPVAATCDALLSALLAEWAQDHYREQRAALRSKAFDDLPQAEATTKLVSFMRERGWLPRLL